jgi:hypothetical protein
MGYANTLPYSYFEFGCATISVVTGTTTLLVNDINTITVPDFENSPDYAYIDIFICGRVNSSANPNYIKNSSSIGVRDDGGQFRSGGTITEQTCYTAASTSLWTNTYLFGITNLAQYILPGVTVTPGIEIQTQQNNLTLYDVTAKVRLYTRV